MYERLLKNPRELVQGVIMFFLTAKTGVIVSGKVLCVGLATGQGVFQHDIPGSQNNSWISNSAKGPNNVR
jgi:hypothetical protein